MQNFLKNTVIVYKTICHFDQQLQSQADEGRVQKLIDQLEQLQLERDAERRELLHRVDDTRLNFVQSTSEAHRVEDSLRWEIGQLQKVCGYK